MSGLPTLLDDARQIHEKRSERIRGLIDGSISPAAGQSRQEEIDELTRKLMSTPEIMLRFG